MGQTGIQTDDGHQHLMPPPPLITAACAITVPIIMSNFFVMLGLPSLHEKPVCCFILLITFVTVINLISNSCHQC